MGKQAFEGVKVADFSWAATGPEVARLLANLGAEVIHIESNTHLDLLRTTGPYRDNVMGINKTNFFAQYNGNKYGISLNLRHPRGAEIARRIVFWSDIVIESFMPGTIEHLGLGYDELSKAKPTIIMFSTCNQGQTGPQTKRVGLGTQLTGASGLHHFCGWPDRGPSLVWGAYTDFVSIPLGAAFLIAALDYQHRTGKGQHLDMSQIEATLQFLAPQLLDYSVNKRIAGRAGNRCSWAAPHGVFQCHGEDSWCAIAVFTDEEWQSLCKVIGNPEWTKDAKFSTLLARKENEDELESLINDWTGGLTPTEVMSKLQAEGVAAGVVQNCQDIQEDIQLNHRHQFWEMEHPEMGKHHYEAPSFILSKTPAEPRRPAPCLGEHNTYVYTQVLGISDDEFVELLADGVFE